MTTIYFVRHAHSPWVANREAERPLSEDGRADAARVADLLSAYHVDAVVSSPYARARQTVRPTAERHGLEVTLEDGFRERQLTDGPAETIGETFDSAIARVWEDWEFAWPGSESNLAAQKWGVEALGRTLRRHAGESVVVGTHGNLLTLILNHYDDRFDFEFWNETLTTPDIYEVAFSEGELATVERRYSESE